MSFHLATVITVSGSGWKDVDYFRNYFHRSWSLPRIEPTRKMRLQPNCLKTLWAWQKNVTVYPFIHQFNASGRLWEDWQFGVQRLSQRSIRRHSHHVAILGLGALLSEKDASPGKWSPSDCHPQKFFWGDKLLLCSPHRGQVPCQFDPEMQNECHFMFKTQWITGGKE